MDIHPDHIDPDTGRPYPSYSDPSLEDEGKFIDDDCDEDVDEDEFDEDEDDDFQDEDDYED